MASVNQLMEVARAERELGNDFFHQNMFGKAMRKYEKVCLCGLFYDTCHCWGVTSVTKRNVNPCQRRLR